ncbi:MAG: extensin family protein [Proteobacteria bacterium]|nr:extensin family protein [Pseudomonadota bacterium]
MIRTGDLNSAKRTYWRAVMLAASLCAAVCAVATEAAAAGKKPHHTTGPTDVPKTPVAPSPAPNPAAASAAPSASDPRTADKQATAKLADAWSDAEVADARAHCAVVLQRIHAVALPHAPIREGACGAPAPVELISVGQNPQVTLSPPAIVRCDLVEQFANWVEKDVQPLARKNLKSAIVRIETMSSYSCRNAYGRKSTKLSEHALANAIDIGGFVTKSEKTAEVLDDWGMPLREIAAEAVARKKAAEDAAAKTAQASVAGNPAQVPLASAVPSTAGALAAGLVRSTIIEGVSNVTVASSWDPGTNVNRLGGPRAEAAAPKSAFPTGLKNPPPEMQAFLHDVHASACRTFGTTLGPEANAAHRNHFHIDTAPRKFGKICD